jgi:PadR family transcriptional regulator PadR
LILKICRIFVYIIFRIYKYIVYTIMKISKELLKGSLKSIVLKLLSENNRMYGYEITQKVETLSNGAIKLTYGALYPILHKLESDGHVQTETEIVNNRTRVYYMLTEKGNSTAKEKVIELEEFINIIRILLNPNLALELCKG